MRWTAKLPFPTFPPFSTNGNTIKLTRKTLAGAAIRFVAHANFKRRLANGHKSRHGRLPLFAFKPSWAGTPLARAQFRNKKSRELACSIQIPSARSFPRRRLRRRRRAKHLFCRLPAGDHPVDLRERVRGMGWAEAASARVSRLRMRQRNRYRVGCRQGAGACTVFQVSGRRLVPESMGFCRCTGIW